MRAGAIRIIGGGPAGATAAIAARRDGAEVRVFEKSQFPRHKVCGEFLSPDAALVLQELGILPEFLELKPFAVRSACVAIGRATKRWKLDEPAFGISRFSLDRFLLGAAQAAGAQVIREKATDFTGPVVIAAGRYHSAPAGTRHFGFKAHFTGPLTDSIDLLFEREMYVGINCIEGGATNVCGLASEEVLKRVGFKPDDLLDSSPPLKDRLAPLSRTMEWLITGPLVYGGNFEPAVALNTYLAGDALGFVDPFTGSGMLGAMATGYLAGRACAAGTDSRSHSANCHRVLKNQYRAAGVIRSAISQGWAEKLLKVIPGNQLFKFTRPGVRRMLENPASYSEDNN